MKKYLVALDQGTTSSRAIVFDRRFCGVTGGSRSFSLISLLPTPAL